MKRSFSNLFSKKKYTSPVIYDYSTSYTREETASRLLAKAAQARQNISEYWKKMKLYYDGKHPTAAFSDSFGTERDLPFECAQSTDGYIHVESQIDPALPGFEFSPRGKDDAQKAKQREKLVRYICDRNDMEYKNSRNERHLGILGTAVWKVCWDSSVCDNGNKGDILIDNPNPSEIYPDPDASCVDDCEYIGYVYTMHREKARRIFAKELSVKGIDFNELVSKSFGRNNEYLGETDELPYPDKDSDTVRITEWWFRQPVDGESDIEYTEGDEKKKLTCNFKAGDIALSIFIGDTEVRYIPKYWNDTDCTMFPFVIYDRIPGESGLWGKSELEAIIPMIDAADREIAYAQLNSAFSSNDIIVAEENAVCDDCELDNSPGAIWKLRPGMMGKVQRLGNGAFSESYLHANYDKWRDLIQETTGNFAINQGNEPQNVTTATGIALLNERAKNRSILKKIDKSVGFRRLYELCDRTALEYYDDGRMIFCGAADDDDIIYRASEYRNAEGENTYIPGVDIKIHIGDGLSHSKAFTVSAVNSLISTPITAENYRIIKSYLELIELPMRQEICDMLDERFGGVPNEDFTYLSELIGGKDEGTSQQKVIDKAINGTEKKIFGAM